MEFATLVPDIRSLVPALLDDAEQEVNTVDSKQFLQFAKTGYCALSALFCALGILFILMPAIPSTLIGVIVGCAMIALGVIKLVGYLSRDLYQFIAAQNMSEKDVSNLKAKLADAINGDLSDLIETARSLLDASKAYTSYSGTRDSMEGTVRFVYRTDTY